MSSELSIYKENRINDLKNSYKLNIANLNSSVIINVRNVQNSRLNTRSKQVLINNLINQYYSNVNALNNVLNKNIDIIKKYEYKTITINKNKKALLIGINYAGTSNELYGCINDVNDIKERGISKQGFNNINVMTDLTTKKATRNNILEEFTNLLINSQEGDLLFFLFSGHGSYVIDKNGDENTGYDQLIVPCDFNTILDDELKSIIQKNLKPNVTLFAMFDSCFSGSVFRFKISIYG